MDNIKVLEEIGLKKVCDDTHIEQKYLKYMIDRNFDKLNHTNTLGFIKILSREYNLDLSEWCEEFEEYWEQSRKPSESDGFFIVLDKERKERKPLALIVVIVALLGVSFLYFQGRVDVSNYMSNNEIRHEQIAIVQKAQEALDEVNSSLEESTQETLVEDLNSTIAEDEVPIISVGTEEESIVTKKQDTEKIVEQKRLEEVDEPVQEVNQSFSQEATIVPNIQLWIGAIYLDTKERRSFLGEGNFTIDISREQIITTGHGDFNLIIGETVKEFKSQAPMRFLVKNSNFLEIGSERFRELNEGKLW